MNKNCYNQQNLCLYKSGCPQFNLNCGEQTVQSVYAYFTVKLPDSTVSSVSPFPLDVTSSYNYNNGNPYIIIDDTTWQQITSQVPKGVKLIAEIIVHDSDGCLLCSTNFLIDIVWFQHELVTATQDPESSPFLTCQNVDDCVELVDNNDGTYTFTAGDTPSVTFDTNETPLVANSSATIDFITSGTSDHIIDASVKISTAAGNDLSSDATGLFLDVQASETKTVISYDPVTHTISYTDEDNSITNLVLNNGSISYFPATNDLQYVSENGTTTTLSLNNIEITNTITGHKIADIKNELGLTVQVNETVTTVLNTVSGHKIADYTNENGDVVDINETVTGISSVNDIYTYTNEDGNTFDIDASSFVKVSNPNATSKPYLTGVDVGTKKLLDASKILTIKFGRGINGFVTNDGELNIEIERHAGGISLSDSTLYPYNVYTIGGNGWSGAYSFNYLNLNYGEFINVSGKVAYIAYSPHYIKFRYASRFNPQDDLGTQLVQSSNALNPVVLRPSLFKNGSLFSILYTQYLPANPYNVFGESFVYSIETSFVPLVAGEIVQFGFRQHVTTNNVVGSAMSINAYLIPGM